MLNSVGMIIIGLVVLGVILLFLPIMLMIGRRGQRPIHSDPSGRFPEPPPQDWLYSVQRRFSQPFFAPPLPEPDHHHHHHHHHPAPMPELHHHHHEPPPVHHEPPSPPPMHHHS